MHLTCSRPHGALTLFSTFKSSFISCCILTRTAPANPCSEEATLFHISFALNNPWIFLIYFSLFSLITNCLSSNIWVKLYRIFPGRMWSPLFPCYQRVPKFITCWRWAYCLSSLHTYEPLGEEAVLYSSWQWILHSNCIQYVFTRRIRQYCWG